MAKKHFKKQAQRLSKKFRGRFSKNKFFEKRDYKTSDTVHTVTNGDENKPDKVIYMISDNEYDRVSVESIKILDSIDENVTPTVKLDEVPSVFSENIKTVVKKKKQSDIDKEIVNKFYRNQTPEMFTAIWNRFYYGVHSHAYKIYGDWDRAADAVQDTFQRAWEKRDMFDPEKGNYSTWLYTICYNICITNIKKETNDKIVDMDVSDIFENALYTNTNSDLSVTDQTYYTTSTDGVVEENTYDDIEKKMYDASIHEIENMEPLFQQIIELKDMKNLTLREIAEQLNLKESKVKNCYYKNKAILMDTLMNKYSDLYGIYKDALKEHNDSDELFTQYKDAGSQEDYITLMEELGY